MSAATDWSAHLHPEVLPAHKDASLLRFITCGSVDDGKSTLIGRLLHDTGSVFEDQMDSFRRDSKKFNAAEDDLNYALLVDGLSAEREQGITIDVAYRYFSTARRFFIIADTPGHEQYTRNMATGASQADLAVILIDARKGVLPQTRRHSFITSMVGVRSVVIAVNKMDLVNFDQNVFDRIVREYKSLLPKLDFRDVAFIPLSARYGINLVKAGREMPWYNGPTLFEYLETVETSSPDRGGGLFHLPIQWINRPNMNFRGFCGTIAQGSVCAGDIIRSLPSGEKSRVKDIYNPAGKTGRAAAGEAVILTLEDEIDTSRGDVLVSSDHAVSPCRAVRGQILWMSARPMVLGKRYLVKLATSLTPATISQLEEKIDIHSYCAEPAKSLGPNEIGHVLLKLERPMIAAPYNDNRALGAFILIDPASNETIALGTVRNTFSSMPVSQTAQEWKTVLSRLRRHWVGGTKVHSGQFKGQLVIFRLACALASAMIALVFGASGIGAFSIFIFDFILRSLLKGFLHPLKKVEPAVPENGAHI